MAPNTTNIARYPPAYHCIPWLAVFGTVCLAIVILNIITIIIFVKRRQLQRKSTCLIIHLAIVDLLVGPVTGPLFIDFCMSKYCDLWEDDRPDSIWLFVLGRATGYNIDKVSLLNLAFISLERTHTTFCPFKHRSVKKWVYGVVITVTWLYPVVVMSLVFGLINFNHVSPKITSVLFSYISILLLVIFACYVSIYIKVRRGRFSQLHGTAGLRERKLTSTMFLVTFGSFLTFLPQMVFWGEVAFDFKLLSSLPTNYALHISMLMFFFFFLNSLINPIIYTIRMPEFRAGILQILFRKTLRRSNPVNIPL